MQQEVEVDRSATFSSCLWWIWRWRNEFIFQNMFLPTEEKLLRLKKYSNEVIVVLSSQHILDGRVVGDQVRWVGWNPPIRGWLSLSSLN